MSISTIERAGALALAVALAVLAGWDGVSAQTAADRNDALQDTTQMAPASQRASPGRFRLELGAGGIYDTNIEHDDDALQSWGAITSIDARYFKNLSWMRYTLHGELAAHNYTQTDRFNRISKLAAARFVVPVAAALSAGMNFELALQGRSQDRVINDQFTLSPRLMLGFGDGGQVRLYGAQRWRKSKATDASADNQYAALSVRTAGSGRVAADFRTRIERNESELERDSFRRWSHAAALILPIADETEFEVSLQYMVQHYENRSIDDPNELPEPGEDFRRDRKWTPQVALVHELMRRLELEVEYEFERRTSSDPGKKYNAHNFAVFTTYRF